MSATHPPVEPRGEPRRRPFPIFGWIFVVLAVLAIGVAFAAQRIRWYASERLAYRDEFLTPDLDRYPMQRKGTSPESVRWAPDGIVFDPPTGASAYVELDASNLIREQSRFAGVVWRLIGNRRPPPVGLLEIEVAVHRRGGYVTILDWGNIVVQDTAQGVMMTVIDSQLFYTNYVLESSQSETPLIITIQHDRASSCIVINTVSRCVIPKNENRTFIRIGESKIDYEHSGSMILRRINYT